MLDDRPAPERIPAGCTPKDLIYGDPDKVDDLVIELRAYAGAFDDGRDQLQVLEFKEWSGEGASAFEQATERLPKELSSAHKHFLEAAASLDAYADKLRSVQKRCNPIIEVRAASYAVDRLTVQSLTSPAEAAQTLLQQRTYAYRADDHVTEIRELTSGTRRFDVDPIGRVTAVQAHGWSETYAYDNLGNLAHATAPDHPSGGDRDFSGTLIRRAGRTVYEHDAQGRLVRRTRKLLSGQQRTWTFTWNAEDRLTDATTPDGNHWQYTYDPLGRRTAKQRLGADGAIAERIVFTWDGTRLVEQATMDGHMTTWDYVPGTHRPLTQADRHTQAEYDTRFHAIITDIVGTPTELVTPDGHIAWQHRTAVWGTGLPTPHSSTPVACPLRFPGQYRDQETGLNYNCFRYYDDEVAGYVSADPLGLSAAPNHHAYVPNPFGWLDPLGLKCLDPDDQVRHDSARATAVDSDGKTMGEEDSPRRQNDRRGAVGESPPGPACQTRRARRQEHAEGQH